MAFKTFPRLKAPPALFLAPVMLTASLFGLWLWPNESAFLGINLLNIAALLLVVILSRPIVPRLEQNIVLLGTLFITLALYAFYRGFPKLETYFLQIFEFFPAVLFYYAVRFLEVNYGLKKALEMTQGWLDSERLDFADRARAEFRKKPGALQAAAQIYKEIAEEGFLRAPAVHPVHILAMRKYGKMLLFNEARGKSGEGEWYAKKANELSLKLLKYSDTPPTIH